MEIDYSKLEKIIADSIDSKYDDVMKRYGIDTDLFAIVGKELQNFQKGCLYHDLSSEIKKFLEESDFYSRDGGWLIHTDGGSYGFSPEMIAPNLIRIAIECASPIKASTWLKSIIESEFTDGFCVRLLWGIKVTSKFEVFNDVFLMPIEEIPNSPQKEWATDDSTWFPSFPHQSQLGMPKCALVKKLRIQPLIFHSSDEPTNVNRTDNELLKEIQSKLTLSGPSPVMECVSWFHFEDKYLNFMHERSWGHIEAIPAVQETFGDFLPAEAEKIVHSYFQIKEANTKNKIDRAIGRLNLAMRRSDPGDAAVELSIALECLFADNPGENTYKIGLRVALLLGGNATEKIRTRSIISALYTVRSELVHNGSNAEEIKLKKMSEKWSTKELIKEACKISACAISKIIELNELPDWYELELNA